MAKEITALFRSFFQVAKGEDMFRLISRQPQSIVIFEGSKNELAQDMSKFPGLLDLEVMNDSGILIDPIEYQEPQTKKTMVGYCIQLQLNHMITFVSQKSVN